MFAHFGVLQTFNDEIMTSFDMDKNKMFAKKKDEDKGSAESIDNQRTRTSVIFADKALLLTILKRSESFDLDQINFFGVTKSNDDDFLKFNPSLRPIKRRRL